MSDTIQSVYWTLKSNPEQSGWYLPLDRDNPVYDKLYDQMEGELPEEYDKTFLPTNPRWYGFWAQSPLNQRQVVLLTEFLQAFRERIPASLSRGLDKFLGALTCSQETGVELHVVLPPPGHIDFGIVTNYVHCPRCKAEGLFERWQQDSYPKEDVACHVCGYLYSPAATYSSRREREFLGASILCNACGQQIATSSFPEEELDALEAQVECREMVELYQQWRELSPQEVEQHFQMFGKEWNHEARLRNIQRKIGQLEEFYFIPVSCPWCQCRINLA